MKEIENELHGIHTQYKAEQPPVPTVDIAIQDASQSFATINLVSDGSPAETAVRNSHACITSESTNSSLQGLRVGDEIIEFGSVSASNFRNMQSIAAVVSHSEGVG